MSCQPYENEFVPPNGVEMRGDQKRKPLVVRTLRIRASTTVRSLLFFGVFSSTLESFFTLCYSSRGFEKIANILSKPNRLLMYINDLNPNHGVFSKLILFKCTTTQTAQYVLNLYTFVRMWQKFGIVVANGLLPPGIFLSLRDSLVVWLEEECGGGKLR